jgi:hypothetical protein
VYHGRLFIDGRRVPAGSGETAADINPATGEVICRVARATEDDVNRAVDAARTALDPATELGPLAHQAQLDKTIEYVRIGIDEGATLRTGGRRIDRAGYFHQPTVSPLTGGSLGSAVIGGLSGALSLREAVAVLAFIPLAGILCTTGVGSGDNRPDIDASDPGVSAIPGM